MKYDPQRDRLYRLETEAHGALTNSLSLQHVTRIARRLCVGYSVPRVPVYFEWDAVDRYGYYEDLVRNNRRIVLNERRGGCNLPTLLHEITHHVIDCYWQGSVQDHGSEFVTILRDLFSQYRIISYARFDELAVKHKVKHGW